MSEAPPTKSTWLSRIFPHTTDFYALLNEQCEVLDSGAAALLAYMQSADPEQAERILQLEHEGDRLESKNMDLLHRAFATPMDREDIYRAVDALDNVLNYAKSTVREMSLLGVAPDEHTLEMAEWLKTGTGAIREGFLRLEKEPLEAERWAEKARKTERRVEKIYRRAIAELFDADHYLKTTSSHEQNREHGLDTLLESDAGTSGRDAIATSFSFVLEIMKRREIYRHLSNAADRVVAVGEVLHDIVVKAT